MLANAHGIGVILLDTGTPAESQVLIPANDEKDIDWDIVNRIAQENRDFKEYLEAVKDTYQGTALKRQKDWYTAEK